MKQFYGTPLSSPLMLGTALYPSPAILADAFVKSGASVATVSVRRELRVMRQEMRFSAYSQTWCSYSA